MVFEVISSMTEFFSSVVTLDHSLIMLLMLGMNIFLLFVSSGSQTPTQVPRPVFPHVRTLSGDTGRRTSVQLCQNRAGAFARVSFVLWIQSSDTVLLHTW